MRINLLLKFSALCDGTVSVDIFFFYFVAVHMEPTVESVERIKPPRHPYAIRCGSNHSYYREYDTTPPIPPLLLTRRSILLATRGTYNVNDPRRVTTGKKNHDRWRSSIHIRIPPSSPTPGTVYFCSFFPAFTRNIARRSMIYRGWKRDCGRDFSEGVRANL